MLARLDVSHYLDHYKRDSSFSLMKISRTLIPHSNLYFSFLFFNVISHQNYFLVARRLVESKNPRWLLWLSEIFSQNKIHRQSHILSKWKRSRPKFYVDPTLEMNTSSQQFLKIVNLIRTRGNADKAQLCTLKIQRLRCYFQTIIGSARRIPRISRKSN